MNVQHCLYKQLNIASCDKCFRNNLCMHFVCIREWLIWMMVANLVSLRYCLLLAAFICFSWPPKIWHVTVILTFNAIFRFTIRTIPISTFSPQHVEYEYYQIELVVVITMYMTRFDIKFVAYIWPFYERGLIFNGTCSVSNIIGIIHV